jgi:hypothetical protein
MGALGNVAALLRSFHNPGYDRIFLITVLDHHEAYLCNEVYKEMYGLFVTAPSNTSTQITIKASSMPQEPLLRSYIQKDDRFAKSPI